MTQKKWILAAAALLVVAIAIAGLLALSGGEEPSSAAQNAAVNTARVEQGDLSSMITLDGTLTYRAQRDGSPYPAINQAKGTYTELPNAGDRIGCGEVLYRVDDNPVLLLCGAVPAYRDLSIGATGGDVGSLNRNLHVAGNRFTSSTASALAALQGERGMDATGSLALGDAVFLPSAARVYRVTGKLGGSAQPGAQVAQATSDKLEVRVDLDASQQGLVKRGDRARITLPGNTQAEGRVNRLGRVARTPTGQDPGAGGATIPAYIGLDHPAQARGLDQAPVQVEIRTKGVENALSVPVTALVGKAGGGFAVEVVRNDGRRELVAVKLGLFDTSGGRVQVVGELAAGEQVVVPSL